MKRELMSKTLARLARTELTDDLGLTMQVDFGSDFWNALFYGTLKTFVERVDSTGFCQTSYGEENGVKCYGQRHYPRDASEAARALADCGFVEPAIRIIEFNLRHIPEEQYYVPHVYRRDGSIQANTIQVDTPAHVANALVRCVELAGPTERLGNLYTELNRIMEGTWQRHFHEDLNLLDAGNFNEQGFGGGSEPICDLFTNTSMACAMQSMDKMAGAFGDTKASAKYRAWYELLREGMEKHLFDSERGIYSIKHDLTTGQKDSRVNWMSLYCRRWYAGNALAWETAFDILEKITTLAWDDMRVITELPGSYEVLGKTYAQLLAYLGQTGRYELLKGHLTFAEKTVRKPSNIFPERWLYRYPEPFGDYHKWFFSHYEGVWEPYAENPDGDYTVDSGNCEQSAVFLSHMVEDLLGIRSGKDALQLWPKLPFEFANVSVKDVPVKKIGERTGCVGYELVRSGDKVDCRITADDAGPIRLILAITARAGKTAVSVNGETCNDFTVRNENDVRWVTVELPPSVAGVRSEFTVTISAAT